tara:strand:- start:19 stop:891 length:873 start_codon:yes stop_codon:yes gene_type:complete
MKERYSPTERLGVNHVESIFLKKFKWIFREQPILDMGIDAQVEYIDENGPTGKLIGLQIKTGLSHFHEKNESFTFYLNDTHYKYWINHSLPVLIVGHIPEYDMTIWEFIDKNNVEKTPKGWKIEIVKENQLDGELSVYQISDIIKSKTINAKVNKLHFDKELMKHIRDGGKINIYTEEWHNKSLGRGPFKVILIDEDGNENYVREWSSFYTYKLDELIQKYFPWADFGIDFEFYEENFEDSVFEIYSQGWLDTHKIYPYKVLSGEVGEYRINLKLNKIGKSFLELEEYLA